MGNEIEEIQSQLEVESGSIKDWKLMKAPKSHWNKIAQYDLTSTAIAPFISSKNGRVVTGLTPQTARELEKELHMKEFELANNSEFWVDFQIKVTKDVTRLDLTDSEDKLAWFFLKSHKLVAFGHDELKKKASAQFVLYNDVDEARATVKRGNVKKEAYKHFVSMDVKEMIDVLMVMGKPIVSTEESIIEAMMQRVVDTQAREFVDIMGDSHFKNKLFVLKCVHYDLLTRTRGKTLDSALFYYGDEFLGEGIDKVVKLLSLKANQQIYLALEKRLETAVAAGTLAGAPILTGYDVEREIEAQNSVPKGPKSKTKRKVSSKAASGSNSKKSDGGNTSVNTSIRDNSRVEEVTGEGLDSGDSFNPDDAPEVL